MSMIRRRLVQTALAILPALTIAGAVIAADTAHTPPAGMEQLHMVMHEIPGPEFKEANRLKNEALHALVMSGDLAATQPKLKAFAQEYARAAGSDPAAMEAHVMEMGAQVAALVQDPAVRAHLVEMHASGRTPGSPAGHPAGH
jgi:hypothetical protein